MNTLLDAVGKDIDALLAEATSASPPPVADVVARATGLARRTILACLEGQPGRPQPAADADLLAVWKVLVKGEPSWHAIRDNCRELVYYGNCIATGRTDALPGAAGRMAARTARHIFLYTTTRVRQQGRL